MTVYLNQTLDIPFAGMILQRNPVNISIVAGNDAITLTLYDPSGTSYPFSVSAGQKLQQEKFNLFKFKIEGSGQAAIAISYPEIIDPSIEVTLNPSMPQSITTPQLPPRLDSSGNLLTRYLGSLDVPGRGWNLGSGDTPNRSWALGSSDVPGRGWNLGSSDVPGRGWNLGSGDTPGRTWVLDSTDNPYVQINSGEGIVDAYDFTSNTVVATVPTGQIWTLLAAVIMGQVYESGSATLAALGILRSNETSIPSDFGSNYIPHALLVMSFASDSPTGGTKIVGSASVTESSTNIYQYSAQEQWADYPVLYPSDEIYFVASNFASLNTYNSIYITYSKQTIP